MSNESIATRKDSFEIKKILIKKKQYWSLKDIKKKYLWRKSVQKITLSKKNCQEKMRWKEKVSNVIKNVIKKISGEEKYIKKKNIVKL